jgi:glycosyltransferase involved in cell wall biosynthesis
MIISFPVLTLTRPMGGAIPPYETANAMRRRGHSVHVLHVGMEKQIRSLDDVRWIDFEEGIEHFFPGAGRTPAGDLRPDLDEITLGSGGRLAWLASYLPAADFIAAYDDKIPLSHGLPFVFMQGYRPHAPALEDQVFRSPCPKVCVSKWLIDIGMQKGVPPAELVYIPNGLKHEKYRLVSPIETRSQLVSTAYHDHPQKGPAESLAVLDEVRRRVPEVEAVVFSQTPPNHETAPWMTVVTDPPQEQIVNEIYNRSSVFLCTSRFEGFGFPSIEAMACGAALVTTANGGSADFAIEGETALTSEPDDIAGLADSVERLLRDEELRIRVARQGMQYVRDHFDWDASASRLEAFLMEYAADPGRFGRR